VADAQRVQEARQRRVLALPERRDEVGGTLLAHAVQRRQLRDVEPVQVRQRAHQAAVDQLVDELLAQAFDVHRAPARVVQQRLLALRGTEQPAGAAVLDAALLAPDVAAAHRAVARHAEVRHVVIARAGHAAHHLGDHVAGTAHDDRVAHAHALAPQLEQVVQRRVADRRAADEHRFQLGHRRQLAGAAHLHLDAVEPRHLLLRRVLVRDRPARLARHEAQLLLQVDAVDLVDHAVDVERQLVAQLRDALVVGHQPLRAMHHRAQVVHRHAEGGDRIQRRAVRGRRVPALGHAQPVGVEAQLLVGQPLGVELADRAGGGVARVDEGLLAALALAGIQALEVVAPHVDLAADLDQRRRLATQPQRDLADRAHVLRHVLAGLAVAARGRLHEHAVLVAQVDGQPVELQLRAVLHRRRIGVQPQLAPHARVEGLRAAGGGVGLGADRQHRQRVLHRRQAVEHLADHALGRRVRGQQLGVRGLDRLQFLEQAVVLGVRDLRRVEHVVEVGMVVELLAQPGGALGRAVGARPRRVVKQVGRHRPAPFS